MKRQDFLALLASLPALALFTPEAAQAACPDGFQPHLWQKVLQGLKTPEGRRHIAKSTIFLKIRAEFMEYNLPGGDAFGQPFHPNVVALIQEGTDFTSWRALQAIGKEAERQWVVIPEPFHENQTRYQATLAKAQRQLMVVGYKPYVPLQVSRLLAGA